MGHPKNLGHPEIQKNDDSQKKQDIWKIRGYPSFEKNMLNKNGKFANFKAPRVPGNALESKKKHDMWESRWYLDIREKHVIQKK